MFWRNGLAAIKKLVAPSKQDWLAQEFRKFRNLEFPYDESVPVDADPISYWKDRHCTLEGKALAEIALPLLQFPQSSASVERTFSALRRVHTWQRASLGREKLAKMIYVYVNCAALRRLQSN